MISRAIYMLFSLFKILMLVVVFRSRT